MKLLIPFAVLAALLPHVPATGATPVRTQVVSFSERDLASSAGRAALDRRIARAAEAVCGSPSVADLVGQNDLHRCRTATMAAASADLARSVATRRSAILVAADR